MVQPGKSRVPPQIPKRRLQRKMLRAFLGWKVKLLLDRLHTLLFWWVYRLSVILHFLIAASYSWPSIWLMLPIGWKSIATSTTVLYTHWLWNSLRRHQVQHQKNAQIIYSSGGAGKFFTVRLALIFQLKNFLRQIFPHHKTRSRNTLKSRNKLSAQRVAREPGAPA